MIKRIEIALRFAVLCYFLTPILLGFLMYEVHTAEIRDWVKADPIALGGVPLIRMCWDLIALIIIVGWIKLFRIVISVVKVLFSKKRK